MVQWLLCIHYPISSVKTICVRKWHLMTARFQCFIRVSVTCTLVLFMLSSHSHHALMEWSFKEVLVIMTLAEAAHTKTDVGSQVCQQGCCLCSLPPAHWQLLSPTRFRELHLRVCAVHAVHTSLHTIYMHMHLSIEIPQYYDNWCAYYCLSVNNTNTTASLCSVPLIHFLQGFLER